MHIAVATTNKEPVYKTRYRQRQPNALLIYTQESNYLRFEVKVNAALFSEKLRVLQLITDLSNCLTVIKVLFCLAV